jgi:preprotein translocase subunit Sec61beta
MGTVAGRYREEEGDAIAVDPKWMIVIKYCVLVRPD